MDLNTRIAALVGMLIGFFFLKELFHYFAPFLVGTLIAAVVHPVVDYCQQKGFPRSIVSFGFVLVIFGSLLLLISFAVVGLWHEVDQLIQLFQTLYRDGYRAFESMHQFVQTLPEPISNMVPALTDSVNQFIIGLLVEVLNVIKKLPNLLFAWILAAMTAFFVIRDKKSIANFFTAKLPRIWLAKLFGLKHQGIQGLFAYIKAQFILMWISACIAISGFLLLNQPYAWVLGILTGLFDFIPVLGPGGIFIPVIVYNLANGLVFKGILVCVVWLILLVIRQIWEPQIMSSQVGLHPLSSIVVLYAGVRLMGISGFIFGPLLAITGKAFYIVVWDNSSRP